MLEQMGFKFYVAAEAELKVAVMRNSSGFCDDKKWLAYWYRPDKTVYVCEWAVPVGSNIIAHEFGHVVGVPHVELEEGPALMNPAPVLTWFDDLDAEAFHDRRELKGSIFEKP
jgi:hypothetical protein